jgi:hypothetical protein
MGTIYNYTFNLILSLLIYRSTFKESKQSRTRVEDGATLSFISKKTKKISKNSVRPELHPSHINSAEPL